MSWFTDLMNKGGDNEQDSHEANALKTETEPAAVTAPDTIKVDLINSEHLFYDLLFGKDAESLEIENSLEQQVVERVSSLLLDPNQMVFEPFPKPLKDALDKIDDDAPIEQIEQSIQQDPVMASEIVKLANSAAFKRTDKDVDSLKMAINFVGLTSLKQIVTAASMGGIMKVSPIYFKLFGEKVWQHSITTANFCETAAKEQGLEPYAAFFVGLIHDIGKIAVFKTLVEAIQQAMPGVQPGSVHFREMMTTMSKQLTVNIARAWELPDVVLEPLRQHITYQDMPVSDSSQLTKILVESKLLSEVTLLLEAKLISQPEAEVILKAHQVDVSKLDLSEQAFRGTA